MNPILVRYAEYCLIYSIPLANPAKRGSKIEGLQKKLQKVSGIAMNKIQGLQESDTREVIKMMDIWGKRTGWKGGHKHIGTTASFCAGILEKNESEYAYKLLAILMEIIHHLEAGKKLYPLSCIGGRVAACKWDILIKE